jgi:nucleotide-binding universal stress UspA family protein
MEASRPILVGVDGTGGAENALRFAARQAIAQMRAVRIVHAAQEPIPLTSVLDPLPATRRHVEEQILRPAVDHVRGLVAWCVPVQTAVSSGPAVRVLLAHSADASVVVLGHRSRTGARRVLSPSTAMAVASRAHCAVVSVPQVWDPSSERGHVLVGVDGSTPSAAALGAAFDAAQTRRASLTVLHAWRLPDQYDAVVGSPVLRPEWTQESQVILSEILAGWCSAYPDVAVDVELHYERPVSAMVEAAAKADLVVLGRHQDRLFGFPIGSVAAALIKHAPIPVMVVPDHAGGLGRS